MKMPYSVTRLFTIILAILIVFVTLWPSLLAQQGKQSRYFCFRHTSGAMVYECEEIQPDILCYDPIEEEFVVFEPTPEWTRLTGEDCTPPDPGKNPLRGQDGDEQTK